MSGSIFTYYAGTKIAIDGGNTISCTTSPLNVALDGTSYIPTSLAFNGFTTSVSGSTLSIHAPTGGTGVTISAGVGISFSGSNNSFTKGNNYMAPSYIVKPSGGGDTPYATNNVTT